MTLSSRSVKYTSFSIRPILVTTITIIIITVVIVVVVLVVIVMVVVCVIVMVVVFVAAVVVIATCVKVCSIGCLFSLFQECNWNSLGVTEVESSSTVYATHESIGRWARLYLVTGS